MHVNNFIYLQIYIYTNKQINNYATNANQLSSKKFVPSVTKPFITEGYVTLTSNHSPNLYV